MSSPHSARQNSSELTSPYVSCKKKKKKKKNYIKFSEMKPAEKVSFFLIDSLRPLALKGITFKAMYSLVLKSSF